jgi:hypothetical protein
MARRIEQEQADAAFGRFDLAVVAARGQFGARLGRQRRRAARLFELRAEQIGHERLGCRVRAVEHDEPERAERPLEPAAEGLGHAAPARVVGAKSFDERARELRLRQRRAEIAHDSRMSSV